MNETPSFWWKPFSLAAFSLAPVSWIYGWIAGRRMAMKPRYNSPLPVLCVGNLVAGGAGKTPAAITIAQEVNSRGLKPGFLTRGYGGRINVPTVIDPEHHNSHDVGDEPVLLAANYTTVVSPDRAKGAQLLEKAGVDFIVMDDGFQNPSLKKDFSLVVVDAGRGIGNGFVIPAGPLRANLKRQLAHASAVLVVGDQSRAAKVVRTAAGMAKPIYEARIVPVEPEKWDGQKVLAFAGIASPDKFFVSLKECGAEIVEARSFGDHHLFTEEEAESMLFFAKRRNLILVTTSKDASRLAGLGRVQRELLQKSKILEINLVFDSDRILKSLVNETLKRANQHRLSISR